MTGKMHDVFIVISQGGYGEHVARTVYAASDDLDSSDVSDLLAKLEASVKKGGTK